MLARIEIGSEVLHGNHDTNSGNESSEESSTEDYIDEAQAEESKEERYNTNL
jgi:hypothetical protein